MSHLRDTLPAPAPQGPTPTFCCALSAMASVIFGDDAAPQHAAPEPCTPDLSWMVDPDDIADEPACAA